MDSQTIRTALGELQEDPDNKEAWQALDAAIRVSGGDMSVPDALRVMARARRAHAARGEVEAVAGLLAREVQVGKATSEEATLLKEQSRVLRTDLFDEEGAMIADLATVELLPNEPTASAAVAETEEKQGRFRELCRTYLDEASSAPDEVYKSSMLMRAAEMELRYGGEDAEVDRVAERLEESLQLDPSNERAGKMLERIYRHEARWADVARVLEQQVSRLEDTAAKSAAAIRLGRVLHYRLGESNAAAKVFERLQREQPDHPEAVGFLVDHYSRNDNWDALVSVYERQIPEAEQSKAERLGDMLQVAMLHWRKRERPADADPWFERIRKIEPANQGMLAFYKDYCGKTGDSGRLLSILQQAQRTLPDGREKQEVAQMVARLAEEQKEAQKSIEQYKSALRSNPDDSAARDKLKELYRKTQGYNALVELLRQQLERTDSADAEKRLEILREVAALYRTSIKSDTALVSVLNQILQIADGDVDSVRELIALYEKLGRARDLLASQQKLADLVSDPDEKADLYRGIARRWLEQFSNVQNATAAFEALLKVRPGDPEACRNLSDLYKKRRAWPQLYELYQAQVPTLSGSARLALMTEMAQLAAERLSRGDEAAKLYREILAQDPSNLSVLDSLERHAERAKDWPTLAEALERRVEVTEDPTARLGVLQKLGTVYADHIGDPAGAVRAWRRVLELQPGHQRALRVLRDSYLMSGDYDGLDDLYSSQNDWEGLADVLSNTADRTKEPTAKIELSYRAAAVYRDRLNQPDRAFRSYERILATDPTDTRAARELIPLYERDEKWARLPALYELLVEKSGDDGEKLTHLNRLVQIAGTKLSDHAAAAQFARRAYEIGPDEDEVLETFERAARAANAWPLFVEALEERLKKLKKKKRRPLELKLAEVYARELGRVEDAVSTYKGLLESDPSDEESGTALETILRRDSRRDDLRWLLSLRAENASSEEERVRVLSEWAVLEEESFGEPLRAAEIYAKILEHAPGDAAAVSALPRLHLAADNAPAAIEVLEKHRANVGDEERVLVDVQLAQLYLDKVLRPADALQAAERVLEASPHDARAIAVLRRLLEHEATKERAAEVLASEYATTGDAHKEAEALAAMLSAAKGVEERRALYVRLCDVQERKLEAFNAALDVMLRAVREFPSDAELWHRAQTLATSANRPSELAEAYREALNAELPSEIELELCEQAARLHEDRLGDPVGASPYLERVLLRDPGNERAFTRLKQILTGAERWSELEALYDRAAAATDDPVQKTDMLAEVALVCEEIIEDPAKATRYYERILEVDPNHEAALLALDRLYEQQARYKELAGLLERRLSSELGESSLTTKLRLGRIQLDVLHEPGKAIDHVEDVLGERPNDYDARQLAERLLEIGDHRVRAAKMLEAVYDARGEIRDLVRVLEIRLQVLDEAAGSDAAVDEERKELLRRIATLRDERLRDDAGALEALARYVPIEPLDLEARERLLEIGRRLGAQARVATVLEQASTRADTPGMRGEILTEVARIYQDQLGNTAKAEETYRKVLEIDPDDAQLALPAARALEKLYVASNEHEKLKDTLMTQIRLEENADARKEIEGRLGTLCETVLSDPEGAITAWKARLEDNSSDAEALAALDRLYERTEKYRELVRILESRRDQTDVASERRELMRRAAETLANKLDAAEEAIDAWRAIVEEFGPSPEILSALESLYSKAERWDDLADTYETHLDIVESQSDRLTLLSKLGDLRRERLSNAAGALATYRDALSIDMGHAPSREALEKLLDSEDVVTRREAAEILHPIYEADGDSARLLHVLEVEIAGSDDPDAKLAGLEKAAQVSSSYMNDPARAFEYTERAVREAAGHADIRPWLAQLERLAMATGRRAEQVKLLREIVGELFDGDTQFEVTAKIAMLARDALQDQELAREYFEKAVETRPDDRDTLVALESLYASLDDSQALLGVLERRVDIAADDTEKKELLFRRAGLLSDKLSDRTRAIAVYEEILDLGMDPVAVEALESLYASESRWDDLVTLYQRELDTPGAGAADLHVKIASIASKKLHDPTRAFDELEAALEMDRQHQGALAELERVLSEEESGEQRARAAALLEPIYLIRADYDRVMRTIAARLDAADSPEQRRELLTRLAQLHEEQKEDYGAALETMAKLFHEDIADEGVVAELERLAKVAGAEKRLAEIYAAELEQASSEDSTTAKLSARVGEIFAKLGENDRALAFYRRALSFEPESDSLFQAVDALLQKTGRHEDRVELYKAGLDHKYEPADRLRYLHTIAELQQTELARGDEAIETYRQAVEVDETDARALDALTDLYRERERYADLADLYQRRAETVSSEEEAARYRLSLAQLLRDKLGDPARALDQLDEIVRTVPHHTEAIAELEKLKDDETHRERVVEILRPLYEGADDWRRLIKLNEDRFGLARDAAEKVSVLRETAMLWETRGNDRERARRALGLAVEIDPDDGEIRGEYERLAEATAAWDELAKAYETALREQPELASKRDVLATLANVHDARRDDPRRALEAYDRLRELDPSELEPIEKMEQLSMLLSDWPVLDRVLVAKSELVLGDEERAGIFRRLGEVRRDMLEDRDGAIAVYQQAVDLDPQSSSTLDPLIELYEAKGDAAQLVELYQRRVELCGEGESERKYELLAKMAQCYEEKLDDRRKAIDSLNDALSVRPSDPGVLSSLNRLYRAEEMWPELLDNLRVQASTADTPETRAAVRRQIGDILWSKMSSFEDALEAYGQVLSETPRDLEAVKAVRKLGEEHEHLRSSAAGILVPVLTESGQNEELVEVLEMRLTTEADPSARGATLRSIAEVLEQKLGRSTDAESALLRAVSEQPDSESLHTDIERLAASTSGWGRYADALTERAQATFDAALARDLFTRLGRVSEQHLDDAPRAIEAYKKAIEQVGDQPELLEALDRLYDRVGDAQALSDVLERRISVVTDPKGQADLHYRQAALFIKEFNDHSRGLTSLRAALDNDPDHEKALEQLEALTSEKDLFDEVFGILENVYRSRGRTDRLAALFEKRVGFAGSVEERIDMRKNLARVLEEEAKDPAAAQRVLQLGLNDNPSDPVLLGEIERLAPITGNWEGAAAALRDAVDAKSSTLLPDVAKDLLVRVAVWYRDRAEEKQAAEKALEKALEFDPNNDTVLVQIEELQSAPGRERDLVQTLRRRAKYQEDSSSREALYRRAKELADGLSDRDLSESVLREVLSKDDQNLWALAELCTLREAAGDYKELFALLMRRVELGTDAVQNRELRHRAALLAREKLEDNDKAIEIYARLFEDDPTDATAARSLHELYQSGNRNEDLANLLERLIQVATSPADRGTLRMELAKLRVERFQKADAAIELLRAALEEEQERADAVAALSDLYEQSKKYSDLANLLGDQIRLSGNRGDLDTELGFQVRLGELYEQKLADRGKAAETYESILVRHPQHRGTLEALTRLYQAAGDHAAAARTLETLLSVASGEEGVRLATVLADEYRALKDLDRAATALERGLELEPKNARIRDLLRALYQESSAWDKLAKLVAGDADLAEADSEKVKLLRKAADILSTKRKDLGGAAELLERATALSPDDRELMLDLCDAYSASGRGKAAVEVLEKIVQSYGGKRSKELAEIHRRLSKAYLSDGDTARAMDELDKAFRIEPGNVHVLKELGDVSMQVNDLKKAQQMFRALLLQKLEDSGPVTKAQVFMSLGDVHLRLGEKPKAVQMLERALQTDPNLEGAKDLLAQAKA